MGIRDRGRVLAGDKDRFQVAHTGSEHQPGPFSPIPVVLTVGKQDSQGTAANHPEGPAGQGCFGGKMGRDYHLGEQPQRAGLPDSCGKGTGDKAVFTKGAFSQGLAETAVYAPGTAYVEVKAQVVELLDHCLAELIRHLPVPGACQEHRVAGHRASITTSLQIIQEELRSGDRFISTFDSENKIQTFQ